MQDGSAADGLVYSLTFQRNDSLGSKRRTIALVAIGLPSLGIGLGFALHGAWLVLPFAGLEVLALFLAFRCFERHAHDFERVAIVGDTLRVESRVLDRTRSCEFNRHWVQVVVRADASRCRIAVRSHGREVEIGRFLTDDQRLDTASRLRDELRCPR